MMKTLTCALFSALLLITAAATAQPPPAEIWSQTLPEYLSPRDLEITPNGAAGILTLEGVFTLAEAPAGRFTLEQTTLPYTNFLAGLAYGPDSEIIAIGNRLLDDGSDLLWMHFDGMLWSYEFIDYDYWDNSVDVDHAANGGYYTLLNASTNQANASAHLLKTTSDPNNLIWDLYIDFPDGCHNTDLVALPDDGGCLVGGYVHPDALPYITKVNPDGSIAWQTIADATWPEVLPYDGQYRHINLLSDGRIVWTDVVRDTNYEAISTVVLTANGQFQLAWEFQINDDNLHVFNLAKTAVDADDNLIFSYSNKYEEVTAPWDAINMAFTVNGTPLWSRKIVGDNFFENEYDAWVEYVPPIGLVNISRVDRPGPYGFIENASRFSILDPETDEDLILEAIPEAPWEPVSDSWVHLPPGGGSFDFTISKQLFGQPQSRDVWVQVSDRDPEFSVELERYFNVPLFTGVWNLEQTVPATIPEGIYEYAVLVGDYPWQVDAAAQLTIEKLPGDAPIQPGPFSAEGWTLTGDLLSEPSGPDPASLPSEFAMAAVYPNPFNPVANVTVSLPETAELTVQVFDRTGRLATTLVRGMFTPGEHRFALDGANLASGIYFIHAFVPGRMNQVRKAVLLK